MTDYSVTVCQIDYSNCMKFVIIVLPLSKPLSFDMRK